jgi:hypothetical protein
MSCGLVLPADKVEAMKWGGVAAMDELVFFNSVEWKRWEGLDEKGVTLQLWIFARLVGGLVYEGCGVPWYKSAALLE